jgi:hypothetical protein
MQQKCNNWITLNLQSNTSYENFHQLWLKMKTNSVWFIKKMYCIRRYSRYRALRRDTILFDRPLSPDLILSSRWRTTTSVPVRLEFVPEFRRDKQLVPCANPKCFAPDARNPSRSIAISLSHVVKKTCWCDSSAWWSVLRSAWFGFLSLGLFFLCRVVPVLQGAAWILN